MVLRAILLILCLGPGSAWANADRKPGFDRLTELLRKELSQRYPGARVDLVSGIRWTRGEHPASLSSVRIQDITPRGEVQFVAFSGQGASATVSEGWAHYSAWVPAKIALKRLPPGEKLADDHFLIQDVNVAQGAAYEYRGVILGNETEVLGLETRQTVLEGQFLTSSAVQRVPDVRRGDAVRIQLVSGDLSISTLGVAEEPAYLQGRVRVMASKSKREFVGQLVANGVVEVKL